MTTKLKGAALKGWLPELSSAQFDEGGIWSVPVEGVIDDEAVAFSAIGRRSVGKAIVGLKGDFNRVRVKFFDLLTVPTGTVVPLCPTRCVVLKT